MYELASPRRFIWFFDPFLECKLRQRKNIWGQILPLDRRAPGPLAPTSRGTAPAAGPALPGAVWGGEQGWGHGGSFAPWRPPPKTRFPRVQQHRRGHLLHGAHIAAISSPLTSAFPILQGCSHPTRVLPLSQRSHLYLGESREGIGAVTRFELSLRGKSSSPLAPWAFGAVWAPSDGLISLGIICWLCAWRSKIWGWVSTAGLVHSSEKLTVALPGPQLKHRDAFMRSVSSSQRAFSSPTTRYRSW